MRQTKKERQYGRGGRGLGREFAAEVLCDKFTAPRLVRLMQTWVVPTDCIKPQIEITDKMATYANY